VLHALEVNHVKSSVMDGKRNVIDRVVPQTNVDLVSYSCYDAQRDPRIFLACLQYMAAALKPKPGIDGNRVMIGEFGLPETAAGLDAVQCTLTDVVDVSLAFGCHVGGMTSGGLGETDIGQLNTVAGMAREFYQRVYAYY